MWTKALIIIWILLLPVGVGATTYYVSPTGETAWPNCTSEGSPCAASASAKSFLGAVAGDTINFIAGTYSTGNAADYENPAWTPSNSGSSGSLITFKCLSGTCTIQQGTGPAFGTYGQNYIVWDGFTATKTDSNNASALIRFGNSSHSTLKNCSLTGNGSADSINVPVFVHTVDYFTLKNNYIQGSLGPDTVNSAGFTTYFMTNSTVENNTFYNNRVGLFLKDGGSYNTVRKNFFNSNVNTNILVGTEDGVTTTRHLYIYQNVSIGSAIADMGEVDQSYIYIYNNTCYNTGADGILVMTVAGDISTLEIFNNILHTGTRLMGIRPSGTGSDTGVYINYNDYYNSASWNYYNTAYTVFANWQGAGYDANGVTTDPGFINAGGSYALVTDFKRSSYTANGRGGSYSNVMGAYLDGTEIIGTGDAPAPDSIAPVATAFVIPATGSSTIQTITTFTCTDAVGVTGYIAQESSTPPSQGAQGWTGTAPATFTFDSYGAKNLYAFCKDAAGNVSTLTSTHEVDTDATTLTEPPPGLKAPWLIP